MASNMLICISHLRWDFVWQRPQHLLSRLAQNRQVLFVEEPLTNTETEHPYLEILPASNRSNLTILRLVQPAKEHGWIGHGDPLTQETYNHLLREYLNNSDCTDAVLWLYTPMASDFVPIIDHKLLIFDVMDQLLAFKGASPDLKEREQALLAQAHLVFTGGASLYRDKRPFNPQTYLFPSGVEIEHFAKARQPEFCEVPADLAPFCGKPIIGYYGVIDERIDLHLIGSLASARPDWQIVMIGPVVKIAPEELPQASNIFYLGSKQYQDLPLYLACFDVAILPFALNESTRYISPTKTLEYMAARKPMVSMPIHDVIELYSEVVRVARSDEAFIQFVDEALREENTVEHQMKEEELLNRSTWDSIAQQMSDIIETQV